MAAAARAPLERACQGRKQKIAVPQRTTSRAADTKSNNNKKIDLYYYIPFLYTIFGV